MYPKGNKGGIDPPWIVRQFCCVRLFPWSVKINPLTLTNQYNRLERMGTKDENTGYTWTFLVQIYLNDVGNT